MIKAPYNFVPLSDKVYFPDWAEQISHDIPFEDGLSGTIELKITAESPIFVRNGHTKRDAEEKNETYNSFNHIKQNYFIPATSIKGAIRNVLQIMSFGKMFLDKDAMFAQREWDNKSLYPIKHPKCQANIHCGYLKETGDGYEIIDCGLPKRIAHTRIDEYIGKDLLRTYFSKKSSFDITKEYEYEGEKYDPKSAFFKYALTKEVKLCGIRFTKDDKYAVEYKENRVKVSTTGEYQGNIVFTGQPDKWMYPRPIKMTPGAGKFYEFVFLNPEPNAIKYKISDNEFNHYKFIYTKSPDWEYAKKKIATLGIPVFFRIENGIIKDWGLAYLYKLPYEKSPYDTLPESHKSNKHDLAECIFGYISKKREDSQKGIEKDSLRGRVFFSNAFTNNAIVCDDISLSLGSPKASYYPIYIRQNGRNGIVSEYDTYNDGKISGWKRYLVRANTFERSTGNTNIDTNIRPLAKGTVFFCKIMFHNLKRVELGALLSAISFHNTNGCFHQLGQGKPYGFGKVSLTIDEYPSELPPIEDLLMEYEEIMHEFLKSSWVNSVQMTNLITLTHSEVTNNDMFDYMQMSNDSENNEFLRAKVEKEYLDTYNSLCQRPYTATSLYEKLIRKREEQQEKLEKERLELLQKEVEEAKQREEEERKQRNSVPLSEKIANVGKLPTLFGNLKTWMKQNNRQSLSEDELTVLHDKIVEIYAALKDKEKASWKTRPNQWKDLTTLLGQELVEKWLQEL